MKTERKYKVFIVDDEKMIHLMLKKQLSEQENLDLHYYENGEEALEALKEEPDMVILDFHMDSEIDGAMNGQQTLMKIKEKAPEVQVIMLSSQEDVSTAVNVLKRGAVDYVVKNKVFPVHTLNSVKKVIQSIELKEQIRELTATVKRDKLLFRGYSLLMFGVAASALIYFLV